MPAPKQNGFTLIELSIVLVIIGLVIGGIMAGKTLIRSAQLRKLISDKVIYETAFYAFQNKYNCIAGDCPNATDFLGTSSDCADAHCKDLTTSGGTCNYGNGNGMIDVYFGPITTPYLTEDLLP